MNLRSNECEHGHDECEHGCDERGIALQTIIIVVVLLAIAGAVSAVLLTRAGTETDRLEGETDRWTGIANETGCEIAGGVWNSGGSGSCNPPGTVVHNAATPHNSYHNCHTASDGSPAHAHTGWTDNNADLDNDPTTDPEDGTCA
ncbi:MAG: hypothetical protein F4Z34_09795 [Acidimicrobiaceae bacterium]|nr:hypothetical protein [Acidimicrobiaceae bacterium]